MKRKRITQLFPFLLPISRVQRKIIFCTKMHIDRKRYAKTKGPELLPFCIYETNGITKVLQKDELSDAVTVAFQHDNKVIIKEAVDGFEVGCAVLGNDSLAIGEVDEIELSQGFFDHLPGARLLGISIKPLLGPSRLGW